MDRPSHNQKSKSRHQNRRELKRRCREILADHIKQQTNLTVDPAKVRLTNTTKDGYCWLHEREVAYIFSECLSRQKIKVYKRLCSEVGVTFLAIRVPRAGEDLSSLRNPVVMESTPPELALVGNISTGSSDSQDSCSVPTELLHQLLISVQQSLVVERADREMLEQEVRNLKAEREQLTTKYCLAADLMQSWLHALDVMAATVGELREDIGNSKQRMNTEILRLKELHNSCDPLIQELPIQI